MVPKSFFSNLRWQLKAPLAEKKIPLYPRSTDATSGLKNEKKVIKFSSGL